MLGKVYGTSISGINLIAGKMGEIHTKQPVLLLIPAFAAEERALLWGREKVVELFGPIVLESDTFRFDRFTDYYAPSMGTELIKRIWAFENPIDPERLAAVKVATNRLESEYALETASPAIARPLNLDPGYLDLGKLILASTKDHSHRIYLQQGIFAELTLIYTKKHWQSLPWTYPDYQSKEYHEFFDQCRDYLFRFLREKRGRGE